MACVGVVRNPFEHWYFRHHDDRQLTDLAACAGGCVRGGDVAWIGNRVVARQVGGRVASGFDMACR